MSSYGPPLRANVEHLRNKPYDKKNLVKAYSNELVNHIVELVRLNPIFQVLALAARALYGGGNIN